jgi:hypothetical protein
VTAAANEDNLALGALAHNSEWRGHAHTFQEPAMAFPFKQFSLKDIRVDALREGGVLLHAKIFAAVMVGLVIIDWYTAEPYWAHWVFLGWGGGPPAACRPGAPALGRPEETMKGRRMLLIVALVVGAIGLFILAWRWDLLPREVIATGTVQTEDGKVLETRQY